MGLFLTDFRDEILYCISQVRYYLRIIAGSILATQTQRQKWYKEFNTGCSLRPLTLELDLKRVLAYPITSVSLTFAHIDGLKISTDSKLKVRIISDAPRYIDAFMPMECSYTVSC